MSVAPGGVSMGSVLASFPEESGESPPNLCDPTRIILQKTGPMI